MRTLQRNVVGMVVAVLLAGCATGEPLTEWKLNASNPDEVAKFRAAEERCRNIVFGPPETRVVNALFVGGGPCLVATFDVCMAQAGFERSHAPHIESSKAMQQEHCRQLSGGRADAYEACMKR